MNKVYYQAPIHEDFNRTYAESGLQPWTGGIVPIRNVKTEQRDDPKKRRGGAKSAARTARKATGVSMQATGAVMQGVGYGVDAGGGAAMRAGMALSATGVGSIVGTPLAAIGGVGKVSGKLLNRSGKLVRQSGRVVSRSARSRHRFTDPILAVSDKLKATRLNITVMAAGMFLWVLFQMTIAMFSAMAFGLAASYSALRSALEASSTDGVIASGLKTVLGVTVSIISTITEAASSGLESLTGFSFEAFNPFSLLMMMSMIMVAFAIMQYFVLYMVYKLAGFEPLGGKATGLKMGAVMLGLAGYALPLTNFFPWFIVWATVIWFFPK